MQTIDEVREHCRLVGKGNEKAVADGEDLNAKFEGQITMLRFKLEKDGGRRSDGRATDEVRHRVQRQGEARGGVRRQWGDSCYQPTRRVLLRAACVLPGCLD